MKLPLARKKAPHRPAKPPQAECTNERSPHRCCPHHPPHHQSHQAPSPTKGWSWPCAPSTSCKWRCCPPKIPLTGPTCGKRRGAHRSSQSTPRWPQWGHRTMATKTSGSGRCEGSPAHRRAWPLGAHEVLQPRCLQCRQHHRCCQRPCPPRTDHHHGEGDHHRAASLLGCFHASIHWAGAHNVDARDGELVLLCVVEQVNQGLASHNSWLHGSRHLGEDLLCHGSGLAHHLGTACCALSDLCGRRDCHAGNTQGQSTCSSRGRLCGCWLLTQVAHLLLVHLWAHGRGQECLGSRIGTDTGNCHGASFGRHDAQRRTSNPDWMLLSTKISCICTAHCLLLEFVERKKTLGVTLANFGFPNYKRNTNSLMDTQKSHNKTWNYRTV